MPRIFLFRVSLLNTDEVTMLSNEKEKLRDSKIGQKTRPEQHFEF